jgi:PAS domain S-box-containing protein
MIDSVFEHALDGVVAVDRSLVIVGWNPAAERMVGYTRDDVVNRSVTEVLVVPDDREAFEQRVERARQTGDLSLFGRTRRGVALCKDGSELPIEFRIAHLRTATSDGTGELAAYVAFFQPSEEAWDRAEHRFRAFVEHASDMIICLDADGRLIYASPAAERITGHRPEEHQGTIPIELFHPDSRELAWESLAATAATPGLKLPVELTVMHADGGTRQLEFLANNLLGDPDVRAIVINVRDVTERRAAEEALRVTADRMAALLRQLRLGIVLLSGEHLVVLVNQTFCDLFSLPEPPDALVGLHGRDLAARIVPMVAGDPDFFESTRRAILGHEPFTDLVMFTADGRILERSMEIIESEGDSLGSLWMYEDVTERAVVAQTLADQNAQLQEIDQMRADWLANASHELRTPITAIGGAAELLGADTTDEARALIGIITRNTERISKIVSDLLTISELDELDPELARAAVDIPSLCARAVETVSLDARSASISIDLKVGSGPPVMGDGERLAQLLDNLVTNAVKFTPSGGHVTVWACYDDGTWTIEVRDDGIGIPAVELETTFLRFRRGSNARDRQIPGTGLGLTIAKAVADLHSATIDVESIEGEGTTVRVRLPTDPCPEQGTHP